MRTAFVHGMLYSPGWSGPSSGTLVTDGGNILFVGSDTEARPFITPNTEVIECRGRLLLPGFQDTHLHPLIGAEDLIECGLSHLETLDEYLKTIKAYAGRHPEMPFIKGSGWVYGAFPTQGPHKKFLDQVVPDRPVFFKAMDGHSAWVNSRALELGGIDRHTAEPEGGQIEREPGTMEPTGYLRGWPAMLPVFNHIPKISPEELLIGAREFFRQAAKVGLTGIHDARGKERFMGIYRRMAENRELTARLRISLFLDPQRGVEQFEEIEAVREKFLGPGIRFGSLKIFMDGAIEGHTAFLLDPYTDKPQERGELHWDPGHLNSLAVALDAKGWQMHFHAVGDGAARMALEAIETTVTRNGPRDSRHQIAHADLFSPEDFPRVARAGALINYQPAWFYRDRNYSTVTLPQLGPERVKRLYSTKDALHQGVRIACSSDWPFGGDYITMNPLEGIQVGVTRQGIKAPRFEPLNPGQALSLQNLLDAHILGSAFAEFQDHETGTLDTGKKADLILLDRNIFESPSHEISQARVLITLFEGKPVWRDGSL